MEITTTIGDLEAIHTIIMEEEDMDIITALIPMVVEDMDIINPTIHTIHRVLQHQSSHKSIRRYHHLSHSKCIGTTTKGKYSHNEMYNNKYNMNLSEHIQLPKKFGYLNTRPIEPLYLYQTYT